MTIGLSLKNVSFMVVEDNDFMRDILIEILRAFGGRRIVGAANGRQAIERFAAVTPDVLVTDWLMSPVDGIELTRYVRTDRASPNPFLPIIMVTGYTSPVSVVAARDAGVTELLAKPISATTLYGRIHHALACPRPFVRVPGFWGPDRRRQVGTYRGAERRRTAAAEASPGAARADSRPWQPGPIDRCAPPATESGGRDFARAWRWAEETSARLWQQRQIRRVSGH